MRAFRPEPDGTISAELTIDEVAILLDLASQFSELLRQRPADDAALDRLLPDAYPDDGEASAEFRRFTADGLVDRKLATASVLLASIRDAVAETAAAGAGQEQDTLLRLDAAAAQSWLTAIGDLRLTIASRLGIEEDGDAGDPGEAMTEVYDWLGFVQGSLVDALDGA
ncbi:DUF2017 family protein [Parafrigoribacterium soli]|uniref:DUF2017 family protein n=1 Tax=Parafrigoribacterium soli TaxID=3144663 RepID=UPI0032EDC15E